MVDKSMETAIKKFIGEQYVKGTFQSENSEAVRAAYRDIVDVNQKLFDQIQDVYGITVKFTDDDPYENAADMRRQVLDQKEIRIYTGGCEHPFLTPEENLIGRAVHDVFAHMVCGCPFTFAGEYNAYLTQRKYYPKRTWAVLFAEIPAQTAAYYYSGGFTYTQRSFQAPVMWMDLCATYLEHDYSKNSVISAPAL